MAVSPDLSSKTFAREVDEELRREQIANLWSRHGGRIVAGIVALLALVAAGLWWHGHRDAGRGVEGEQLQAAFDRLEAGDAPAASAALASVAATGGPGYRALARMAEANIALDRHDTAGAVRLFGAVAADDAAAKPFRDLALVRETAAQFDALKPDVVVQRLRALAMPGQPFFGSAAELVGLSYLRMNRRDLAGTLFAQVAADETAPASVRQRAVQMASVLASGAAPQGARPQSPPQHEGKPAR